MNRVFGIREDVVRKIALKNRDKVGTELDKRISSDTGDDMKFKEI